MKRTHFHTPAWHWMVGGTAALVLSACTCAAEDLNAQSVSIPKSIFTNAAPARNPFYPNSTFGVPQAPKVVTKAPEAVILVLNGLSGPPRRTAVINGRTFEPGEKGEVRTEGGARIMVVCEEITDDGATIAVNGQRRMLRMRNTF